MEFSTKQFNQLSVQELYQILKLRMEVFVVEQDCVYQDIDGRDEQALHIMGTENNRLVAYARCFPPGNYFEEAAIGRVIIHEDFRGRKLGHELMKASLQAMKSFYPGEPISLSAQLHLTEFYKHHGFTPVGEDYMEDDIPHIKMIKASKP